MPTKLYDCAKSVYVKTPDAYLFVFAFQKPGVIKPKTYKLKLWVCIMETHAPAVLIFFFFKIGQ